LENDINDMNDVTATESYCGFQQMNGQLTAVRMDS